MVIVLLFMANLLIGSVPIPVSDVFSILMGHEGEKASWSFIVWESRLPQALTALLCGGALAVCGLMLQTAFKNPLAGPSILGINSGASLGVAFVMLFFGGSISAGTFVAFGVVCTSVFPVFFFFFTTETATWLLHMENFSPLAFVTDISPSARIIVVPFFFALNCREKVFFGTSAVFPVEAISSMPFPPLTFLPPERKVKIESS